MYRIAGTHKQSGNVANHAQRNIAAISEMEKAALEERTRGERFGDALARSAGQMWFITIHALWFGAWIIVNRGIIPGVRPFDPYPFPFLTFVVSLEAIFLSLFILMSQNRASRQADARANLDLQINLLSEQEATKMLQMLKKLCEHHGLTHCTDPELQYLASPTEPEDLLRDLKKSLPENG
jgi:uncharacterized membrane protein